MDEQERRQDQRHHADAGDHHQTRRDHVSVAWRGVAPGSAGRARCNATKQKGRSQDRDS